MQKTNVNRRNPASCVVRHLMETGHKVDPVESFTILLRNPDLDGKTHFTDYTGLHERLEEGISSSSVTVNLFNTSP